MGHRTVKRVPLDFDWAQGKVWAGYLQPDSLLETGCDTCDGHGTTFAHQWVGTIAHLLLMVGEDPMAQERGRPLHPWLQELALRPTGRPGSDAAELSGGFAGRGPGLLGHDAIDRWAATRKIVEAAGLPAEWGVCPTCQGHGAVEKYDGQRAEAEAWEPTEPPTGEGWQLWETVTEGSPASPVFPSAEALATWCESNATWFANNRWTREEWLRSFLGGSTDVDSLLTFRA